MDKSKKGGAARKKTRLVAAAATLAILCSAGVFGGYFYLQHQAQMGQYPEPPQPWDDPRVAKAQRDARLEKAKFIREKWRGWAFQHKDVLRRLVHAKPGDEATLAATWEAIPLKPSVETTGFTQKDLSEGLVDATWQPGSKTDNDPKGQTHMANWRRDDFKQERDIALSGIMNVGPAPTVWVWASGRITEQEPGSVRVPGTQEVTKKPQKEILPAYDFLEKPNSTEQ